MSPAQEKHRRRRLAFAEFIKLYPFTPEDLEGEEWRPIEGYDGYQISNFGRVKSLKNCRGCAVKILRPRLSSTDYLIVQLLKNAKFKWHNVHRLVAKAFISNPGGKPQVNHIDGCAINNYVGNLEWVTNAENVQHAYDIGLAKARSGSDNYGAKLTNENVLYIKNNPDGLSTVELGKMFNVTPTTISDVQLGKKYREVGGYIRKPKIKHQPRLPDNVRDEIRQLYVKWSSEFGCCGLAKKFSVTPRTICTIIHEKD